MTWWVVAIGVVLAIAALPYAGRRISEANARYVRDVFGSGGDPWAGAARGQVGFWRGVLFVAAVSLATAVAIAAVLYVAHRVAR